MARDEAPPFARGETFYNQGSTATITAPTDGTGLGGVNLEGKEFTFEPNSQDNFTNTYSNASTDPSGRPIRVKVVRNVSGQALKPYRIAIFSQASTNPGPLGTAVGGYASGLTTDLIAGVIDEFLPPAGVANNDLFYVVLSGPSVVQQGATTASALTIGQRLIPATYGASSLDDLAGRVTIQSLGALTGATLAVQLQQELGFAVSAAASTATGSTQQILLTQKW